MSDGSTDRTDEIVQEWAERHAFIRLVRVEKDAKHDFAAKVHALRQGLATLENHDYDLLGILDADVTFGPQYFEALLARFADNPQLGVAGGNILQVVDGVAVPRIKDLNTVAGAVQMFRRKCFEQTGGFPALPFGGEDAAVEISARMHGWQTQTFPELEVRHRGLVGGDGSRVRARFRWGRANYSLGYHPLYQLARALYRLRERPYLLGSAAELTGYAVGRFRDGLPAVPSSRVQYLRHEQLSKLKRPLNAWRNR